MKLKFFVFSALFLSIMNTVNAQPGPPPYPECPDPYTACPIDGGASLLLGAGVAYGMKKIRDNKKSKKDLKDTI